MNQSNIIRNKFNHNALKISSLSFIYEEIATRMINRLTYIKKQPLNILDLGSGMNFDANLLAQNYPQAQLYKLDLSLQMLKTYQAKKTFIDKIWYKNKNMLCADALNLPIATQSIDLIWSNLILPYIYDYEMYFKEIRRVLSLGGFFLLSGLGVDSLKQLRELGLSTYSFPDMHIIGDILVKLGFTNPVTDIEYITLEYANINDLLADIRLVGCGAVLQTNYLSKKTYLELKSKFSDLTNNSKIPLTLEIFYAHAWKDKITLDLPDNTQAIQFKSR